MLKNGQYLTENERREEQTIQDSRRFNGYQEAEKIQELVSRLLDKFPVEDVNSIENFRQWAVFSEVLSGCSDTLRRFLIRRHKAIINTLKVANVGPLSKQNAFKKYRR